MELDAIAELEAKTNGSPGERSDIRFLPPSYSFPRGVGGVNTVAILQGKPRNRLSGLILDLDAQQPQSRSVHVERQPVSLEPQWRRGELAALVIRLDRGEAILSDHDAAHHRGGSFPFADVAVQSVVADVIKPDLVPAQDQAAARIHRFRVEGSLRPQRDPWPALVALPVHAVPAGCEPDVE